MSEKVAYDSSWTWNLLAQTDLKQLMECLIIDISGNNRLWWCHLTHKNMFFPLVIFLFCILALWLTDFRTRKYHPLTNMQCLNTGPVSAFENTSLIINFKKKVKCAFVLTLILTVHPVIMQMMRGEWQVCHALLRKMRNSQEWRLLRTQAGGKLTLAERRETASEKRWVEMPNFTRC